MAKVLVADDFSLTIEMLESILTEAGYEVCSTHDGKYVVKMIENEKPDLVILDVYMPEQDGIQTLSKIRQQWKELPVISVTGGGKSGHDYSELMLDLGADGYFTKPINTTELLSAIEKLV